MGMSCNCSNSVKVSDLACCLCNKVFHKKHVPNYHKKHMSEEEEDADSFVCHIFSVCR